MLSLRVRVVLLAALAPLGAACRSQPPPSPSPGSSTPPPPASSPVAAEAAAPPVVDAGPPVSAPSFAAFEAPDTDRRTFRHLLVGALTSPALRPLGVSLTGKENDESIWQPPVETNYVGPRSGDTYALAAVPDASGASACEKLPATLQLTCKTEQVAVLPAGAALVPGRKRNDDKLAAARWQPDTRERMTAIRCDLTTEGTARPIRRLRDTWPLVFVKPSHAGQAPGPGIEWAYANSDQVVQEGAYRWMPSSSAEKRR